MTKLKLLELKRWQEYCSTQTLKINISTRATPYKFRSLGTVIDQHTKKGFAFDLLVTVPSEMGSVGNYATWVFDSTPCLAPARWNKGIRYLHPSRISQEDQIKLRKLYIDNQSSL